MLRDLNKINIVLIPKEDSPKMISQHRPIVLCNFVYKVISKVLANRMKVLLSVVISPQQVAFVPNRQIQDSIIIVNEELHHMQLRKKGKVPDLAVLCWKANRTVSTSKGQFNWATSHSVTVAAT